MSVRVMRSAVLGRRWRAALVMAAGFTTVVASSTVAVVAGAGTAQAVAPSPAPGDKGDKKSSDKGDPKQKRRSHEDDGKRYVECDPDALVAALVSLNELRGGDLVLAKDCTYTLTANLDGNGLPRITQPISIFGHGATIARAANADSFRLFEVGPGGDLKLRKLTLTRGKAAEAGDDNEGGAIRVSGAGRLELDDVKVLDNTVDILDQQDAGGLMNEGIATVRDSTFHRNSGEDGAAIYSEGKTEITDSEITSNIGDDEGNAVLYNDASMKLRNSLVSNNNAEDGGGLHNDGVLEIEKSAIVDNVAGDDGGAIDNDGGALFVRDSVFKGNVAHLDGGALSLSEGSSIVDSEIADNAVISTDAQGGGVNVRTEEGEAVSIRRSKIVNNQAPGNGARGGGIFNEGEDDDDEGVLRLTDVKVTKNLSDAPAGGVHNNGTIFTYGKVRIVDNVPTNCEGSDNPVPNCFG
ncbi:right-handed parallel beta-helix repeat-containing protein [Streptomyces sp. NPDC019396]|uniref:right-handed parallel beta-helix repeat-containing protein n=1 Tax=Streptomyces sp. NPDC019396 TaxID=3154687 RepID=UPI0033E4F890